VARLFKTDVEAARKIIERGSSLLAKEREKRERPFRDEKIISAWNGLMIGAMARGYAVLGDRRFLETARKAADFLLTGPGSEEGLPHVQPGGKTRVPGFLEDYALVAEALLDLWEADFEPSLRCRTIPSPQGTLRPYTCYSGCPYWQTRVNMK
jgi:uncharacterized protein YyaL (SSP411 family)